MTPRGGGQWSEWRLIQNLISFFAFDGKAERAYGGLGRPGKFTVPTAEVPAYSGQRFRASRGALHALIKILSRMICQKKNSQTQPVEQGLVAKQASLLASRALVVYR